jgi:tetratricopeptide (TPR) repeat protein
MNKPDMSSQARSSELLLPRGYTMMIRNTEGEERDKHGLLEQSISSYQRAIHLHRDADRESDEAASLVERGHIERQLGLLDQAQETYMQAQKLYQSLHQVQDLGHVELALGHIELQRATWNTPHCTIKRPLAISEQRLMRWRLMPLALSRMSSG